MIGYCHLMYYNNQMLKKPAAFTGSSHINQSLPGLGDNSTIYKKFHGFFFCSCVIRPVEPSSKILNFGNIHLAVLSQLIWIGNFMPSTWLKSQYLCMRKLGFYSHHKAITWWYNLAVIVFWCVSRSSLARVWRWGLVKIIIKAA